MNINHIYGVKVTEKYYIPDRMDYTEYEEFSLDGFVTYKIKKGSRKKLDKKVVSVPEPEMIAFFDKLYKFVRQAEEEVILIDDHYTKVELAYSPYHYEVFDGAATCKGQDTLIHQIGKFIMAHEQ